jgi:predicted Zn-dependent protease
MERLLEFYKKSNDYEGALKTACNLAEAVPMDMQYLYVAGQLLLRAGRTREARAYLQNAIALKPGDPDMIYSLAETYFFEKNLDETVRYLNEVLQLNPDHEAAKKNLETLTKLKKSLVPGAK